MTLWKAWGKRTGAGHLQADDIDTLHGREHRTAPRKGPRPERSTDPLQARRGDPARRSRWKKALPAARHAAQARKASA
jgi:hypothetical protein